MSLFVIASSISVQDWEELLVRKLPLAARECAATVWRGRRLWLWQRDRGDKFQGFSGTQDSARDSQEPPLFGRYSSDIPFPTILNGSQWSIDDNSLPKLQVLIS